MTPQGGYGEGMEAIVQEPAALGAFVAAITEGLKRSVGLRGGGVYLANVALSLVFALLLGWAGLLPASYPFPSGALLFGVYAALSASGLYEAVKNVRKAVGGGDAVPPGGGASGADRGRLL